MNLNLLELLIHSILFYSIHLPVNSIHTLRSIAARIGVALVDIDLAVGTRSSRLTAALIPIYQIFTLASKLAWVRGTLIQLGVAQSAGKPWVTGAGERVFAVNTLTPVTRVRGAVVDVGFAAHA
jgi:hypothetical protein